MNTKIKIIGCGILEKEILYLINKNKWDVELNLSSSLLHMNMKQLSNNLNYNLQKSGGENSVVFYGCCHPKIDEILLDYKSVRTSGQNCIEILLGPDLFIHELEKGAYFLLEDWTEKWSYVLTKTFGTDDMEIIKEIFKSEHNYLLAISTPVSGNFNKKAEDAARILELPLRWLNANLDHLESILKEILLPKLRHVND